MHIESSYKNNLYMNLLYKARVFLLFGVWRVVGIANEAYRVFINLFEASRFFFSLKSKIYLLKAGFLTEFGNLANNQSQVLKIPVLCHQIRKLEYKC